MTLECTIKKLLKGKMTYKRKENCNEEGREVSLKPSCLYFNKLTLLYC